MRIRPCVSAAHSVAPAEIVGLKPHHPGVELGLLTDRLLQGEPLVQGVDVQTALGADDEICDNEPIVTFSEEDFPVLGRNTETPFGIDRMLVSSAEHI